MTHSGEHRRPPSPTSFKLTIAGGGGGGRHLFLPSSGLRLPTVFTKKKGKQRPLLCRQILSGEAHYLNRAAFLLKGRRREKNFHQSGRPRAATSCLLSNIFSYGSRCRENTTPLPAAEPTRAGAALGLRFRASSGSRVPRPGLRGRGPQAQESPPARSRPRSDPGPARPAVLPPWPPRHNNGELESADQAAAPRPPQRTAVETKRSPGPGPGPPGLRPRATGPGDGGRAAAGRGGGGWRRIARQRRRRGARRSALLPPPPAPRRSLEPRRCGSPPPPARARLPAPRRRRRPRLRAAPARRPHGGPRSAPCCATPVPGGRVRGAG